MYNELENVFVTLLCVAQSERARERLCCTERERERLCRTETETVLHRARERERDCVAQRERLCCTEREREREIVLHREREREIVLHRKSEREREREKLGVLRPVNQDSEEESVQNKMNLKRV